MEKILNIDFHICILEDVIFEGNIFKKPYPDEIYSMWIELNVLYHVFEAFEKTFWDEEINFSIEDELIAAQEIYKLLEPFHQIFKENGEVYCEDEKINIPVLEERIGFARVHCVDYRDELDFSNYEIGSLFKTTMSILSELNKKELLLYVNTKGKCFDTRGYEIMKKIGLV